MKARGVEFDFFFQLIMTLSVLVVAERCLPSVFADLLQGLIFTWIWIYFLFCSVVGNDSLI